MKGKEIFGWYLWAAVLLVALNFIAAAPVMAREPEKKTADSGIEQIIDLLEQKGIITSQEAENLKRRPADAAPTEAVERQEAGFAPKTSGTEGEKEIERLERKLDQQIDDVQSKTRINAREIERLEKERIDKLAADNQKSSWAQRISFDGDLRLRFEGNYFDEENYPDIGDPNSPANNINSTVDRERLRARVRLGLKAGLIDPRDINVGKVDAAFRLTAGSTSDPVSTNETLGDSFNKDTITLDRYYLQWAYKPLLPIWDRIPQISLTGGRMPNPWFSSDLVWDDDLNFEGLAFNLKTDTLDENGWHLFFTGGLFPLQELDWSEEDKWLYAGQIGVAATPVYGLGITLGAAYYDYENIAGQPDMAGNPGFISSGVPNDSAPLFMQKGNTTMYIDEAHSKVALAANYKILDITTEVDYSYFFPVHVILGGTYARNIGFNQEEVSQLALRQVDEENEAYRIGLKVGYPVIFNFGEWNFFCEYKYIEADAVLDAFNDSDFHLGGTNAKGWGAGMELGLYRNLWLRTRWLTTDEISGPQFAVDTLQFDINARF